MRLASQQQEPAFSKFSSVNSRYQKHGTGWNGSFFIPNQSKGGEKAPQIERESGRIGIFQLYNEGCFPVGIRPHRP